jgi:hypothetical protein
LCAALFLDVRWSARLRGPSYGPDRDPFRADALAQLPEEQVAPDYRLVLVGDAGAPEAPPDPTLALVGEWADEQPDDTTVVFLGDNVYPAGLQANDRERGERILSQLLDSTRARKVFVPGNHDWGFAWNRTDASKALALQQQFIEAHTHLGADFLPENGCPGPAVVELLAPGQPLAGGLSLVLLDLHWWLLDERERTHCEGIESTTDFVDALRNELAARRSENVVIAAHHPIRSGGPHGGLTRGFWRDLGRTLFYRFYSAQDLIEPNYREAVDLLSEVLAENPPLAMVGGQDHSLQILDGGDEAGMVVVSGSATRVSGVAAIEGTLFAHAHRGFVVFDLYAASAVMGASTLLAKVVEVGSEKPVAAVALELNDGRASTRVVTSP